MTPLSASKTPDAEHPTSNAQLNRRARLSLFLLILLCASVGELHAQVGNNNPTGPSGIFNGLIADGVDPYTGNVRRSITDIAVAGAVGEYPLALVRTYNSRTPSYTTPFGDGGWNHSYNWILEESAEGTTQNFQPASYTVDFPDGRVETFQQVNWDSGAYRVRRLGGDANTTVGVRERLAPLYTDPSNNMLAKLLLPDGGKVEFLAERHSRQHWGNNHIYYYYKYTATAIVDPYGLRTTFTYDGYGHLWKVTEPAGRYLQFTYTGPKIQRVTEFNGNPPSAGRYVDYYYEENWAGRLYLDHVIYYNNPNLRANYGWTGGNVLNAVFDLLETCDDPMYPGPMKRIAYTYAGTHDAGACTWAVFGQILSESYWDGVSGHEGSGPIISTLSVCTDGVHNGANYRMETRGPAGGGPTRGFVYTTDGYLTSCTDFMGNSASQGYDGYKYINSVTDRNNHRTDYTSDPTTGNVTQIKFPCTPNDTQPQQTEQTRSTINYTYTNNYYLHTTQGENGQTTTTLRDGNNRVTEIDYPDGGSESFPSYNSFNQVLTHGMVTGGTETFTYDSTGLKQTYRNPDNASGNPTARYGYDSFDRVTDITDVLGTSLGDGNHTMSYGYNLRGQVTSITSPVFDGSRHTLTANVYNDDGTLQSTTDALGHVTSYTYDDYRRLKSVILPDRGDNNGTHTTHFYYGANTSDDPTDYKYTDSNVTWIVLPSGTTTATVYDPNRRRSTVTVAYAQPEAATTGYTYDNVGNLRIVTNPRSKTTTTDYDERNRPWRITDALNHQTTVTYDTAGRKKIIQRPNGQTITYDTFDAMNRVTQQTATQDPNPAAVTKYTYYTPQDPNNPPVGLLHTMKDPRLVAVNSSDNYTYTYDNMGRQTSVQCPLDSHNVHRTEQWSYDTAGRLYQFTNRNGNIETFSYDALNRMTGFSWDDGGLTPGVSFGYDAASRLTSINNANANISRVYYNDNLMHSETETITGGYAKTVTYTYDTDGNRASTQYPTPENYAFNYTYNKRNQLLGVNGWATYTYDETGYVGDLTKRTLASGPYTTYNYDGLDRVTSITHSFNGTNRYFNYGYYANSSNLTFIERIGAGQDVGDVFRYDLADQAIGVQLNVKPAAKRAHATTEHHVRRQWEPDKLSSLRDHRDLQHQQPEPVHQPDHKQCYAQRRV